MMVAGAGCRSGRPGKVLGFRRLRSCGHAAGDMGGRVLRPGDVDARQALVFACRPGLRYDGGAAGRDVRGHVKFRHVIYG